jgi:large subunit ribosomal protein L21
VYAVVETGSKQYRVTKGQTLLVERLDGTVGDNVELDRVLLIGDGDSLTVGQPTVPGAKVVATLGGVERTRKIIVFKYKAKVRYRRKNTHRQTHSRLIIRDIVTGGSDADAETRAAAEA